MHGTPLSFADEAAGGAWPRCGPVWLERGQLMKQLAGVATGAPMVRLDDNGLEGFAPYLMNRIMGDYNESLRAEMAALGLSTPMMRALAVLSVMDAVQPGRLAVYTVVEQSTLSRALATLERNGLVAREPDPADSRAALLRLTEAGRAAFETLWPRMAESHGRMFAGVDEAERAAFVATLRKILANIRKHDF